MREEQVGGGSRAGKRSFGLRPFEGERSVRIGSTQLQDWHIEVLFMRKLSAGLLLSSWNAILCLECSLLEISLRDRNTVINNE